MVWRRSAGKSSHPTSVHVQMEKMPQARLAMAFVILGARHIRLGTVGGTARSDRLAAVDSICHRVP